MATPEAATATILSRIGAAVVGAACGSLALWLSLHNLVQWKWNGWMFWVPFSLLLTTLSALCCWFVLRGDRSKSLADIRATWRGGWLVGVVCFALGYVGPLLITPKSNLGPLLGILLTGPLGFVAGALGTIVYRKLRVQRDL
jgi:hypothetical protein